MGNQVIIEVSARHLHLSAEDLETLFGKGHELTRRKDLSQPGQYACEERVEIAGPKGSIKGVSVLGPVRPVTQVEVSLTDARALGITAPIRESGQITGSAGCTVIGPAGKVEIKEGLIVAKRHIHLTPADAEKFGVADKEIVGVKVAATGRAGIMEDVVVRVSESFSAAMHIDTDEAQAFGVAGQIYGEIVKLG
ncbi:MAG: phosphate propanoyltransferase [Oscillospiraceae bacterium]|nr:phosphate propanoyltransferase [Oscillospiraceae bacterium]